MAGLGIELDVEDPHVREPVSRHELGPEYVAALRMLLPTDWGLGRDGMWVYASPELAAPVADRKVQGFKIHVSAVPDDAVAVLNAVVPHLVRANVEFKIVGDRALHYFF